jgi:putative endonuclease
VCGIPPTAGLENTKEIDMNYVVYILKSLKNDRYYVGCTNDIDRRLSEHNSGRSRSTRSNSPFKLVHKEEYNSLSVARIRERNIKKRKSRKYIESLIMGSR